jgi:hypothetical protein
VDRIRRLILRRLRKYLKWLIPRRTLPIDFHH